MSPRVLRFYAQLLALLLVVACSSHSESDETETTEQAEEAWSSRVDRPLLIAHRGNDSLLDPENVIESIEGLSPWVDGVEIDIKLTADGVPVLMHDDTVDRTTDGTGLVSSFTLEQLQSLEPGMDAGGGAIIPTLEAYLNVAQRRGFRLILLDMKDVDERALERTIDVLNESSLKDVSVIMVRSVEETERVRRVSQEVRLGRFGVSEDRALEAVEDLLQKRGEVALTPPNRYAENRGSISFAQERGLRAGSSTNNDPEIIRMAMDDGVDLILTDIAGELGELFQQD